MSSATRKPLPGALFLALIPVGWLGFTVFTTELEALFGIFPQPYAAALAVFHEASPALLVGWGATAAMAVGAFVVRGRRPFACVVFVALFLVGYVALAPMMYHHMPAGVWVAGVGAIFTVVGIWQLERRGQMHQKENPADP